MKETIITIRVYNHERQAEIKHPMTAYVHDRFPGLAIHGSWELGSDDWQITHVPSGLIIATLPTRAAAVAAVDMIGKLQDWNRPQADVTPAEPGEWRWLKTSIAAAVERVNNDRATALKAAETLEAALEATPGKLPL